MPTVFVIPLQCTVHVAGLAEPVVSVSYLNYKIHFEECLQKVLGDSIF